MKQKLFGFTLIEMMIVVAILGILAAIAYPSYVRHVQRSHRADAEAALMENAQFLERRFTACNAYNRGPKSGEPCAALTKAEVTEALPERRIPRDPNTNDANARYLITFEEVTDCTNGIGNNCFNLRATLRTGSPQAGEPCGNLELRHTGARSSDGNGQNGCW